jgi:hypothetical protein
MTKLLGLALAFSLVAAAQEYTKDGELILPKDYRQWVFLSSSIGLSYSNDPNPTPAFENVFVRQAALSEFLKTGTWPDKTVLMMEVRSSDSQPSNKDGRFQTNVVAHEAHVKDASRGGWAFYVIPKSAASGKIVPKTQNCYSCHEKSGAVDTTFVQFYPTLIDAAKKAGTYKETGDVTR